MNIEYSSSPTSAPKVPLRSIAINLPRGSGNATALQDG
jgi:hypothetical protein